jgi:hypothetical protein
MRTRSTLGREGMGWASWLGIVFVGVVLVGGIGLTIYGGALEPPHRHYEQAVPNDRFPN